MIIDDNSIGTTPGLRSAAKQRFIDNSGRTLAFKGGARLHESSSELANYLANNPTSIGGSPWEAFLQAGTHVIEGWESTGVKIMTFILNNGGRVNAGEINVRGTIEKQDQLNWYNSNKGDFVVIESVGGERTIYSSDGISLPGAGSGSVAEFDFSAGGYWGDRSFEGVEYKLEYALRGGFLPRRRPPGKTLERQINRGMKKEQRATIHVIGLDGTKWMSTTDFILESVSLVGQLSMEKVSSFEGDTVEFSCDTNEVYNFTGKLLDAQGFDQARTWVYNWNNYLDGNILSANKCRVMLCYSGKIVVGYIIGFASSSDARSRFIDSLNFSMYVSEFVPEVYISQGTKSPEPIDDGQYYKDKHGGINDN